MVPALAATVRGNLPQCLLAWTASVAILLSYVSGINLEDYSLQPYQQPTWARSLEFGLILLALGYDLIRRRWSSPRDGKDCERDSHISCTRT